jgi:hypothetical protein
MGKTSIAPELLKTLFRWYLPIVRVSEAFAVNHGMFISKIS